MEFLKRAKKEMRSLGVDVMLNMQANHRKYSHAVGASCAAASTIAMTTTAMATQDIAGFGTAVVNIVTQIYSAAFPVVTVLAALMLVIAFIMRMVGSQQSAAKATSWIVRIIICYVAVNCIGLIFNVIKNTTSSYNFDPNNP